MPTQKHNTFFNNSRFYILVFSVLLSIGALAWLRLHIPGEQLFYIRLQQLYGFFCVLYWYVALIISPVGYVIGKERIRHLEFARRALGVSAFYFAFLHGVIALWGQLGGPNQIAYLPSFFKWSLIGGAVAFSILLVMAATSLDRVIRFMTLRRWKWLHRLVYIGGILAVLHIWSIGTHLAYGSVQLAAFVALIVISALELFRTVKIMNDKYLHLGKTEAAMLHLALWSMVVLAIAMLPLAIQNYHSRHESHGHSVTGRTSR